MSRRRNRDSEFEAGLTRSGRVFRNNSVVNFFTYLFRGNYQELAQDERPLSERITK